MNKKEIKIIVEGKKTLPYKEIIETQGQLKSLSKENYEKLKQLFLQEDFAFCLNIAMVKGKPFGLLDGHQRLRTIRTMVEEEGYQLVDIKGKPTNKLPVTVTHCKNKEHAGQLILSAVSQFGKIDEEGLYEFINEFAVDINSLETFDLPDFDVDRFIKGYKGETPEDEEPTGKSQTTICPACGAEF